MRPPRWLLPVLGLALVVALVLLWRKHAPFQEAADWAAGHRWQWYTPLLTIAVFVVGGFLMVPVMGLVLACGVAFGPVLGAVYAMLGSLASAAAGYGAGHVIGHNRLGRFRDISLRVGRRGILSVFLLRKVPVAPFTIVNLALGASHVSFRDFMIGTALGLAPGVVALAVFGHSIAEALAHPSPKTIAIVVGLFLLIVAAVILAQKFFGKAEITSGAGRSPRAP